MKKRQQKIYVDEETDILLKTLASTKTNGVSIGMKALSYSYYCVFELKNIVNNRILLGVDKTVDYFDFPLIIRLTDGDNLISVDVKQHGRGAFEVTPLGFFPNKKAAIEYKNILVNEYLDRGNILYNNETYVGDIPRVISLPMSNNVFKVLAKISSKKNTTLSKLIMNIVRKFLLDKKTSGGL